MNIPKKESTLDFSKVRVQGIDGIDHSDYPDYCDAYITEATYDGEEVTEEQLEEINNDSQFVYDAVMDWLH
jgi:hypothetical protein